MDLVSTVKTENPYAEYESTEAPSDMFWKFYEMEFTLHNRERFSMTGWSKVLELAEINGWIPAGTEPNPDLFPDGITTGYGSNEGQLVTELDAANIAAALERALDDIPDIDTAAHRINLSAGNIEKFSEDNGEFRVDAALIEAIPDLIINRDNNTLNPFDFFSGSKKQHIRDFIAFCRKGAFSIW